MAEDVYQLSNDRVLDPPRTFTGKLRHLGPGFILSASIVGSGELIATTNFGAEAGFVCMWVIIFSCIVKVALQLEFGKHAIYSGKTTIGAFNDLPGPRIGRASWSIWAWLLAMTLKFLQVGGIIGLVAMALQALLPIASGGGKTGLVVWTAVAGLAVAFLIARDRYKLIERTCLVMIGLFTLFTLISVIALQWTDYSISASEFFSGFSFQIPHAVLFAAIAAFGITGVGGDEIMAYNYWLIEKGYASHTGPRPPESDREAHDAWLRRARGWIRVMTLDALFSLVCYTLVTVLFYLLGAAVVHEMHSGKLPDGEKLLGALASMYTESLGPWAKVTFMIGAIVVLFSTLLAALGAWTRLFADAFGHIGIGNFADPARRRKAIAIGSFVIPTIWGVLYFIFSSPKFMILVGGFVTAVILLLVLFAAIVMRTRWSPRQLRPHLLYDIALVLSAVAIAFGGIWSISEGLKKYFATGKPAPPTEQVEPAE